MNKEQVVNNLKKFLKDSFEKDKTETMHRVLRPDAQPFDKIIISTVPRYKTSGLSGDEWRISAKVEFYRKGKIVKELDCFRDVEVAVKHLPYWFDTICDEGGAYFGGIDEYCDQEGCEEKAVVTYRLKNEFCDRCGKKKKAEWKTLEGKEKPLIKTRNQRRLWT